MAKKRYTSEEIIHKLREADVLLGQGRSIAQACKQIGVTDQSYYRWRKAYGGLKIDPAKRLKELEGENARLKKAVAELTVDKIILKGVAEGKFGARRGGGKRSVWCAAGTGTRNAASAGRWASRVPRSATRRSPGPTRGRCALRSSAWLASMGAMATG